MNHDSDSENVRRRWPESPQPSGGANIIRRFWSFTLLMNLHTFVAEPVNHVHIFHDAHTVTFSSLFQASTVLVCFVHVLNGKPCWRPVRTTLTQEGLTCGAVLLGGHQ